MVKYRRRGHYCKVCRAWKSLGEFSVRGLTVDLCLECEALPLARRNEVQRISRIKELDAKPQRLTVEEWATLRKYARNRTYPELKPLAAGVLERRRLTGEVEKIAYSDLKDEVKEELRELLRGYLTDFFKATPEGPTIRQMGRFDKEVLKMYPTHPQIVPDNHWHTLCYDAMTSIAADLEGKGETPER